MSIYNYMGGTSPLFVGYKPTIGLDSSQALGRLDRLRAKQPKAPAPNIAEAPEWKGQSSSVAEAETTYNAGVSGIKSILGKYGGNTQVAMQDPNWGKYQRMINESTSSATLQGLLNEQERFKNITKDMKGDNIYFGGQSNTADAVQYMLDNGTMTQADVMTRKEQEVGMGRNKELGNVIQASVFNKTAEDADKYMNEMFNQAGFSGGFEKVYDDLNKSIVTNTEDGVLLQNTWTKIGGKNNSEQLAKLNKYLKENMPEEVRMSYLQQFVKDNPDFRKYAKSKDHVEKALDIYIADRINTLNSAHVDKEGYTDRGRTLQNVKGISFGAGGLEQKEQKNMNEITNEAIANTYSEDQLEAFRVFDATSDIDALSSALNVSPEKALKMAKNYKVATSAGVSHAQVDSGKDMIPISQLQHVQSQAKDYESVGIPTSTYNTINGDYMTVTNPKTGVVEEKEINNDLFGEIKVTGGNGMVMYKGQGDEGNRSSEVKSGYLKIPDDLEIAFISEGSSKASTGGERDGNHGMYGSIIIPYDVDGDTDTKTENFLREWFNLGNEINPVEYLEKLEDADVSTNIGFDDDFIKIKVPYYTNPNIQANTQAGIIGDQTDASNKNKGTAEGDRFNKAGVEYGLTTVIDDYNRKKQSFSNLEASTK